MKNIVIYLGLMYLFTFKACISSEESTPSNTLSENEIEEKKDSEITTEENKDKVLTVEEIKRLSFYEQFNKSDLLCYENLKKVQNGPPRSYYDNIVYEGEVYQLDITFEKNNVKYVFFSKKDSDIGVEIRIGSVENVLEGKVSMRDYMEYTLPNEIGEGKYDPFLGNGGGTAFIDEQNPELFVGASELHWEVSGIFENGELVGVTSFANNATFGDFSIFPHSMPCVTTSIEFNIYDEEVGAYTDTSTFWYAFWSMEGSMPVYSLRLDASQYDISDLQQIIETVSFSERAFIKE